MDLFSKAESIKSRFSSCRFTVVCSECGSVAGELSCNRFTKKSLEMNSGFVCSSCLGKVHADERDAEDKGESS